MKSQLLILQLVMLSAFALHAQTENSDSLNILYDDIPEVQIQESKTQNTSSVLLRRSDFLSLPGALEDPTRLLLKTPSVNNTNDQANFIIYRGMPSHFHRWKMYGARILNPNHLPSAGTISDFPNRSAGGVNMISGQIISSLEFRGNAHGSDYNSLAGASNLSLRNPYDNRITTNLSVVGLEVGMDRLIDSTTSITANYRYSFTGLLNALGTDFDGEKIGYQDLAFAIHKSFSNGTKLDIYAVSGMDNNNKSPLDSSLVTSTKDTEQIDFESSTLIGGLRLTSKDDDIQWAHSVNVSRKIMNRLSERVLFSSNPFIQEYENSESLIASLHELKIKSEQYTVRFSLEPEFHKINLEYIFPALPGSNKGRIFEELEFDYISMLPAINVEYNLPHDITLSPHIGYNFNTASGNSPLIGGLRIQKNLKSWLLHYMYKRTSQIYEPEVLLYTSMNHFINDNFEIGIANSNLSFKAFHNHSFFLPFLNEQGNFGSSNLDILPRTIKNGFDNFIIYKGSKLKSWGLEFNTDIPIDWMDLKFNYSLLNVYGSIEFTEGFPQASNHSLNIIVRKSFSLSKNKQLGVGFSFSYRSPTQQNTINLQDSRNQGFTSYSYNFSGMTSNSFTTELASYQRADLRIYYKKVRENGTYSTISLDIQNVMNRENEAHYFFDPLSNEIQLQRQLGMIPVLSWRASW